MSDIANKAPKAAWNAAVAAVSAAEEFQSRSMSLSIPLVALLS
jgi:hypothetical protein